MIGFPECNSIVSQEAICEAHDIVRGLLKQAPAFPVAKLLRSGEQVYYIHFQFRPF